MTEPETKSQSGWTADASTFGARLALVRQHMGWGNVKEAAVACGVPVETWRTWERDNRIPQRLVTIAMAIATRTGCDLDWLIRGPEPVLAIRDKEPNGRYVDQRVIVRIGTKPEASSERSTRNRDSAAFRNRPVRQTRPHVGDTRRPLSPAGR